MITATIKESKKVKGVKSEKRYMKCYHSLDKARKELTPIAKDMEVARQQVQQGHPYVEPPIVIIGVSYDSKSEKNLLLEIKAIITNENEEA
ncbi:MAG: hypothetical protein J6S67_01760 [Methanobrevibacter sp.]|nr:hypothetical protein [Methanobrevibacter sp.]